MIEVLISAAAALAGVALGGALTAWQDGRRYSRESGHEWVTSRRTKLEELAGVVEDLRLAYAETAIALRRASAGNPAAFAQLAEIRVPHARLRVLQGIYAPASEGALGDLELAIRTFNEQLRGEPGLTPQESAAAALRVQPVIETACVRLLRAVIAEAQSLGPL